VAYLTCGERALPERGRLFSGGERDGDGLWSSDKSFGEFHSKVYIYDTAGTRQADLIAFFISVA
jgi:hypothetical protein